MKQGEFRYFKGTKYVQFMNIEGKKIHTAPCDQFRMVLDIVQEETSVDEPEFKYFFYIANGVEVEVDGITYLEAETFFTQV